MVKLVLLPVLDSEKDDVVHCRLRSRMQLALLPIFALDRRDYLHVLEYKHILDLELKHH